MLCDFLKKKVYKGSTHSNTISIKKHLQFKYYVYKTLTLNLNFLIFKNNIIYNLVIICPFAISLVPFVIILAHLVELVDTLDLKSNSFQSTGSSPVMGIANKFIFRKSGRVV